ncbi:MAG: AlpA family transcriptional regulator [Candidatus Saccharimonadales bacterium]
MATALLRLPQVRQLTGLSRSEIYRRMGLGEFPAKVSLGVRAVGWIETEIQQWIEGRIKHSRAA